MRVDGATGLVSYNNAAVGTYSVELSVTDGRGGVATQSYRLSVGTNIESAAPRIISTPPALAAVGALFIYTVSAVDPQRSTLNYALTASPSGMTIDNVTGRISWRPATPDVGVQVVRVEVRNALGGVAAQAWSLNVSAAAPNTPPVFTSVPLLVATAGVPYVYNSLAIDNDTPVQYALINSPTGMNINRTTGRIAWSPTVAQLGNHLVLVDSHRCARGSVIPAVSSLRPRS